MQPTRPVPEPLVLPTRAPDADKAIRQDVKQEATNEFVSFQRHAPQLIVAPAIAVGECYPALLKREEAVVGDRRNDPHLLGITMNGGDDSPVLYADEIEEISELEPAAGYAFYTEDD